MIECVKVLECLGLQWKNHKNGSPCHDFALVVFPPLRQNVMLYVLSYYNNATRLPPFQTAVLCPTARLASESLIRLESSVKVTGGWSLRTVDSYLTFSAVNQFVSHPKLTRILQKVGVQTFVYNVPVNKLAVKLELRSELRQICQCLWIIEICICSLPRKGILTGVSEKPVMLVLVSNRLRVSSPNQEDRLVGICPTPRGLTSQNGPRFLHNEKLVFVFLW